MRLAPYFIIPLSARFVKRFGYLQGRGLLFVHSRFSVRKQTRAVDGASLLYPFSDCLSVLGLRMFACAKAFKRDREVTLLSAIENRPSSGYILSPDCTQYFFAFFLRRFSVFLLNFSPIPIDGNTTVFTKTSPYNAE